MKKLDIELLRFTTAGSVDNGKSTLIGRLLHDSKSIYDDQYNDIKRISETKGDDYINLALLTDGLKDEREQGITIDVAYRYFSTPVRKFIIADTPGHIEYTRNMVTGASTANVALILIDARNGVTEQTKRHTIIASLLQIKHIIVCINKMDLVSYEQDVYAHIISDFKNFATRLAVTDITFIPISALNGDNVVTKSNAMEWYKGTTLLYYLENVHIANDENFVDFRFPIQYVIRPMSDQKLDYRAYAGQVSSGVIRKGEEVTILPTGFTTKIAKIDSFDGELNVAFPPMSISLLLEDDIDISRGDMIVRKNNVPSVSQDLDIMICWFNKEPLQMGKKYLIKHTTNEIKCLITSIQYKLDINTLQRNLEDLTINMNDIARIKIRTSKPIFIDPYVQNKTTGSIIIIDANTNETVAAGMTR